MKKTILVLTGSPRKGGNSSMLADAFTQGAQAAGHDVLRFDAGITLVNGCRGCDACWSKGEPCVFDDGFSTLVPMLEAADALVFATPLYWFGFSAQLKSAIDKFNAYTKERCPRPLKIRECFLMACAADDEPGLFDALVANYRHIASYMNWRSRGVLTVPGVSDKGDITSTNALAKAEAFGKSF